MGRHAFWRHWGAYALALVPLLLLESLLFWRIPFPWAHPFLLPFAIAMVASREGICGGAAYGLFVGLFAMLLGHGSAMLFLSSLVGAVIAFLFSRGLQQGFGGSFLGGIAAFLLFSLLRMLALTLFSGFSFLALCSIALFEFLWSLPFFPLVYGIYLLPAHRTHYGKGGLVV